MPGQSDLTGFSFTEAGGSPWEWSVLHTCAEAVGVYRGGGSGTGEVLHTCEEAVEAELERFFILVQRLLELIEAVEAELGSASYLCRGCWSL